MKIGNAVAQYLTYRTSIGEKHRTNGFMLMAFSSAIGDDTNIADITLRQCCDYLNKKGYVNERLTTYWFCIHSALKGLFDWCYQRGFIHGIPLPNSLPSKPQAFVPHIYTNEELRLIFEYALHYRKRFNISYPEVMHHLLKTIYFLGLRPSEAIGMSVSDIHLGNENYALIRDSKFYKTRITPFNNRVSEMFSLFLNWRKSVGMPDDFETPLFLDKRKNRVKLSCLQQAFRIICNATDIRRDTTSSHSDVRLHDLRHTFATNRILAWYKQGKNVQEMLPLLSTYLGHKNIENTAVYISFIPELMAEAGAKFYNYYLKGEGGYEEG